ncbi:MAG: sulfur carrier protein ThiS [Methanobrevibacter sp.]|jgi:sulfur carrier protein|nr:sulfur carrier protein ThiS [Methanobrevibacter sp.]
MTFIVNFENKKEEYPYKQGKTIQDLLNELEISSETLVVKRNGEIVIEETVIEKGDEIQLIQIIYGG